MATFKARHPRTLPSGYYKPVGQLIVGWGFTELYLQSIIWHVWKLKDPKVARLLTWDLNAVSKVELFGLLAPKWLSDSADQTELKAIATEAERLRAIRNKVAHGLWGYKPGERKKLRLAYIRKNHRITPKGEFVSQTDLKQWARDLDALNRRLKSFHKHLGASAP